MSGFWVFIVDPKNFLALLGLVTLIRWSVKLTKWVTGLRSPKVRKSFPVENLNKDV